MSYMQGKSNKNKKNIFRIILPAIVFIYLLFRTVPSLFAARIKTVLPEYNIVENKIKADAIIIKKEYLYKSYGKGKIETLVKEGEKIAKGTKVAQLTLLENNSTLDQELRSIDDQIAILTNVDVYDNVVEKDKNKLENNIDDLAIEIQQNISRGDYKKNASLRDKLSIYQEKKQNLYGQKTLINQSLQALKNRRQEVVEQISNNSKNYFSQESGIISFKIDGYEEIYPFKYKEDYNISDFRKIDKKQKIIKNKDYVGPDESIFKIVDNFEWYMIIGVENINNIGFYEQGDTIFVSGDDIKDNIQGYIEKINKEGNKGLILCKFNTDFKKYYDKRYVEIDIIRHSDEGYKIPTKSIVKKDNIDGVYVKDISGIIKFKPIKILMKNDAQTYIECGDENNNIKIEGYEQLVKTITMLDEILLNTTNIKEGMVVN